VSARVSPPMTASIEFMSKRAISIVPLFERYRFSISPCFALEGSVEGRSVLRGVFGLPR
jgi:hypothetical protein